MSGERFTKFVDIIKALRHPETGCPWDLEQTHESIRPYLIEEAYEVLEAIDRKDDMELVSELGDLLLQVVLHAQIAKDREAFSIDDVIEKVSEKMVRRHPHVFGETKVEGSGEVLRNWERIKFEERERKGGVPEKPSSRLAEVPLTLPALLRAQRLGEKAAKVSFDWKSISGVVDKVEEELGELAAELQEANINKVRVGQELGDLLFSICQLARWLGVSAEDTLRECTVRFTSRFHEMERELKGPMEKLTETELEAAWQAAKVRLKE